MSNHTNSTRLFRSAARAYRELARLEDADACEAAVRSAYVTYTAYAGEYADATGQSLSDAKATIRALA